MPFEPKDVLTVSLSAVTAAIAIYNWRSGRRRAKLKDDLDILKKYREEFAKEHEPNSIDRDVRIVQLKRRIHRRMRSQYVVRGVDHSDLNTGIGLCLVASATLGWAIYSGDIAAIKGWILMLVTASGFGGIIFLVSAFKDRNEEDSFEVDD